MRRRHSREEYLDLVARIREAIPKVQLSTDMIVGFPGETEADFEETLSLTDTVRYHSMFSFKYSERPNTLASKRMPDDVSEAEKTRRIVALQALQRSIQSDLFQRSIGSTQPGAGRRDQPPARVGADGPHQRQHGGQLSRTAGVAGKVRRCDDSGERARTACGASPSTRRFCDRSTNVLRTFYGPIDRRTNVEQP